MSAIFHKYILTKVQFANVTLENKCNIFHDKYKLQI